jgi:hypothetical protein
MRAGLAISFIFVLVGGGIVTPAVADPPVGSDTPRSGDAAPIDADRAAQVVAKVLPKEGYTLPIKWGDLGVKLVQLGVIDLQKFKQLYAKGNALPELRRLEEPSEAFVTITSENQGFLVTVLWGLGLANKTAVLDRALAERGKAQIMTLASTGGWTLGAKPAAELYSQFDIIPLTPEQEELVSELAQRIYRPCCDNSTVFPDCNHGIALLGLIELMAANGFTREEILKAALNVNAFWFPQQYVQTALLFELRGIDWTAVDPREVLGPRYSSLSGSRRVDGELKKLAHLLPRQAVGATCALPATQAQASAEGPSAASAAVRHIHGLALDRADPDVLVIATHTGLVRVRPNMAPEGVGDHRSDLMGFTVHPTEATVAYASGHPDPGTARQTGVGNLGLLLTRDGGQSWQTVALKGDADFHALTYSSRDGGQLYGWSAAGRTGLYRTSATTWAVESLPGQGLAGVTSLAASPDPFGVLLAGTKAGLLVSRDGGVSWSPATGIPTDTPVTAVAFHATDAQVAYVYAARSDLGLMRSRDGGATWERAGVMANAQTPVVAVAVGPGDHVVVANARSDVMRSRDGGRTWHVVLAQGRLVAGTR